VIAVQDDLPFEAARQFKTVKEYITGILAALARIVSTRLIASVVWVADVVFQLTIGRRPPSQLDPMHLNISRLVIAISRVVPTRIGTS
jgi:hypothetical protein